MTTLQTLTLDDGTRLAYRSAGEGPAVLLLHGWPTSSYLWRDVMPAIARSNRALALDLPGFGGSDKPLGVRYDFARFERAIEGFLDAVDVERVALCGHDLGGPIAVSWALRRPSRVRALALLNTLVYPEFSQAVIDFVVQASTPGSRERITSDAGLEEIMRLGLEDEARLTPEMLGAVLAPFPSADARRALADAAIGLEPERFAEIAAGLGSLDLPLRLIYGERDRILPDIGDTMRRLRADVPRAVATPLPDRGHFVQEEAGEEVGELLATFFATAA